MGDGETGAKIEMQSLLQDFNRIDTRKQGSIRLAQAIKLLQSVGGVPAVSEQTLSKVILNVERQVSFDEFLALLYQAQLAAGLHHNLFNYNMVEFLKLLEDYRKKCEESCLYLQAQKAHQKILEVKDKELRRHKQNLLSQQKEKVHSVNSLQQSRLLQFNHAWNDYMDQYEHAAMNSIQKLKAKHLRQMQQQEGRIKNYLDGYMKPSKRILDLRSKEKCLVKQRDYSQAERIKNIANKLQKRQKQNKSGQIAQRIQKRKEMLQKHQEIALLAHLKRIEKDRNEQIKQRQVDSEKMLIKLRNIQNDLVQKQSVEIRQTLENLRETMCLTSGKLFQGRKSQAAGSLEKISRSGEKVRRSGEKVRRSGEKSRVSMEKGLESAQKMRQREKQFKIRVNSFHRTKMDDSLYDP